MAVAFERSRAGAIPLLIARDRRVQPHGAVIWYHGFGVDKETHRPELERFAKSGFVAIGVDVAGHGERRAPDLEERKAGSQQEALSSVIEFASATAREITGLIDHLVMAGIAGCDRIAIAGISMGAFVVYRAVLEDARIACAVAIIGSPEWPTPDSPHRHAAAACNVALLSITAECDVNVPPLPARRFHEQLGRSCSRQRHRYVELPGAEHLMNAVDWEKTMSETIAWLRAHMPRL